MSTSNFNRYPAPAHNLRGGTSQRPATAEKTPGLIRPGSVTHGLHMTTPLDSHLPGSARRRLSDDT